MLTFAALILLSQRSLRYVSKIRRGIRSIKGFLNIYFAHFFRITFTISYESQKIKSLVSLVLGTLFLFSFIHTLSLCGFPFSFVNILCIIRFLSSSQKHFGGIKSSLFLVLSTLFSFSFYSYAQIMWVSFQFCKYLCIICFLSSSQKHFGGIRSYNASLK